MTTMGLYLRQMINKFSPSYRTHAINQVRNGSYEASKFLVDVGEITTKYEATKSAEDWKYVERLLPPVTVPTPQKKTEYASGWKPQGDNLEDRPYFIPRTRNHMIPVYLHTRRHNTVRHTIVKNIQGDIWQFEKDIRGFLEEQVTPKFLRLQIDELARKMCIHGDHVNAVKYWLEQRNY